MDASALIVCRHVWHLHWCGFSEESDYLSLNVDRKLFVNGNLALEIWISPVTVDCRKVNPPSQLDYSVRKLFTGLTVAAFSVCRATVSHAMNSDINAAPIKNHHSKLIR